MSKIKQYLQTAKFKYYPVIILKKMERRTTSLKIDIELWKKVKVECIKKDINISVYIENLIKEDLKKK